MTPISSQQNPRIKELRKLQRSRDRARTGLFIAEGEDLIAAAIAAGRPAVEGFRLAGTAIGGPGFEDVEGDVLASVSTLGSGTRAIGVYEQRFSDPVGPLCVYLHGVSDPGNVGTILRSALAFGASSVALGPGCADPHSPKAVRAGMGAIFAVPIARVEGVGELPGARVALVAHAGNPLASVVEALAGGPGGGALSGSGATGGNAACDVPASAGVAAVTLCVGAEREGLPEEVVAGCDHVANIPIASESLNAAMAATVALYEMTRRSTRVRAS
ncbi:MAG TPA: RNA methyltransferase [Solirubrobacteraceae bacterium]